MRIPRQQDLTGIQNQIINIVTNTDIKRMAIVGGPGTGKTVLEVIIANKLATDGILCLTYYKLLTNSTEDTLKAIKDSETPQPNCATFFSWLWRWWINCFEEEFDEENKNFPRFQSTDPAKRFDEIYWDEVIKAFDALPDFAKESARIPFLFIDETQDLDDGKLKLLNHISDRIIVAFDDDQNISDEVLRGKTAKRNRILQTLDMEESFFDLIVNFRNTPAVERVAKLFGSNYRSNRLTLGVETAVRKETGRKPVVCCCKNDEEAVEYIISKISRNPEGSHGIIFPYKPQASNFNHRSYANDKEHFSKYTGLFEVKLKDLNIKLQKKFGEDGKGIIVKESGVYFVTDTVAKGLEFDNVYILNAETFACTSEADRNRVYVSVTRAIENLYILFTESPAMLRNHVYKTVEANAELFSREDPKPKQAATEWRID